MTQLRNKDTGRPGNGGKFAGRRQTSPGEQLTDPELFTVPTVLGERTVTAGVWDWPTAEAFLNGQCVAFAAAVAPHVGARYVEVLVDSREDRVIHAWVEDRDGSTVDAGESAGWTSEEYIADRAGANWWNDGRYLWESVPLDEVAAFAADQTRDNELPEQAWAAAKAVMGAFLTARDSTEDTTDSPAPQRPMTLAEELAAGTSNRATVDAFAAAEARFRDRTVTSGGA